MEIFRVHTFCFSNGNGKAVSAQQGDGFNHKIWRNLVRDWNDQTEKCMSLHIEIVFIIIILSIVKMIQLFYDWLRKWGKQKPAVSST